MNMEQFEKRKSITDGGASEKEGEWKTINGAHVFIEKGQSVEEAISTKEGKLSAKKPYSMGAEFTIPGSNGYKHIITKTTPDRVYTDIPELKEKGITGTEGSYSTADFEKHIKSGKVKLSHNDNQKAQFTAAQNAALEDSKKRMSKYADLVSVTSKTIATGDESSDIMLVEYKMRNNGSPKLVKIDKKGRVSAF